MARSPAPAAEPASRTWKRGLLVGTILVALVVIGVLVFLPQIRFQMRIGQLHAADAESRKVAVDALVQSDDPTMNDRLRKILLDPGRAFGIRTQVGEILVTRNRDAIVAEALRSSDLDVRTSALAVLHGQARFHGEEWFQRTYVEDPQYPVTETLTAWLGREGDTTRATALSIVQGLGAEEYLPLVRALLAPPREGSLSKGEQAILSSAAQTVIRHGDCEAVPAVLALATTAVDDIVRLRAVQALYQGVAAPQAKCPDAVPVDAVKDAVFKALEEGGSNTRLGVLMVLANQPEWTAEASERVYAILDGATGDTEYVRRQALAALAELGDEAFALRLPTYFHADNQYIRSQATTASINLTDDGEAPIRYESCWIGVLEREVENVTSYQAALEELRAQAGDWVGLPEGLPAGGGARHAAIQRFRSEIFERGESGGVSRADWAEAWFRWWAEKLGMKGDAIDDAVRVRGEFWTAAAAGETERAAQILQAYEAPHPDLFRYEQGYVTGN